MNEETEKKEETEKDETLFFHGTTHLGFGANRFTVAGKCYSSGQMNLGIAICSSDDQFVKSEGRKIATARLENIVSGIGTAIIISKIEKGSERKAFNRVCIMLSCLDKQSLVEFFDVHKKEEE